MREIVYKFDNGTTSKVAVEDSFFEKYQALVKEQERVDRKETRQHCSLEQLLEYGWDREDTKADVACQLEQKEERTKLQQALHRLIDRQKKIVFLVIKKRKSMRKIGAGLGISGNAVYQSYIGAIQKLKKYF